VSCVGLASVRTFFVEGQMLCTDPCYKHEDDNLMRGLTALLDTRPGLWRFHWKMAEDGWAGERVELLEAWHDDCRRYLSRVDEFVADLGVDSGQMGFFDFESFKRRFDKDYDRDGCFYHEACELTLAPTMGGAISTSDLLEQPFGAVTSSGYGDGSYGLYVARDADGKVVAARVVFIDEELEEESDYEDDE